MHDNEVSTKQLSFADELRFERRLRLAHLKQEEPRGTTEIENIR